MYLCNFNIEQDESFSRIKKKVHRRTTVGEGGSKAGGVHSVGGGSVSGIAPHSEVRHT